MAEPMTREQLIQHAKEHGILTDEYQDSHNPSDIRILGWHIFNESNAKVYVANISGVLIIYVEQQLSIVETAKELQDIEATA